MKRPVSALHWHLLLCAWTLLLIPLRAADQEATAREEWMVGYVKLEEGGRAEEAGDAAQAMALYRDALQTFEAVRRQYPEWNPALLGYRITYCTQRIRRLEGQVKQQSPDMSQQDLAKVVSGQVDKIRALSDENQALKTRLATTVESLERARVESARTVSAAEDIKDVMAERAQLKAENTALRQQLEQQTGELGALRQKSGIEQVAKQLQQDLERTRMREQQLEQAFDTYRKAYENVKEKLRQTTAEQEQWQRQNRDLNDRGEAATTAVAAARQRVTELEARNAVLEQQRTADAAALAQKQADVEQERRDLAMARTELTDLRRLRDQATQESGERQRLVEQAQLLATAKATAEERAATAEKHVATAEERAATAEKRVATAEERAATAEKRVATADARVVTLGTELQTARDRIALLEQRQPAPPPAAVAVPGADAQQLLAAVADAADLRRQGEVLRVDLAQEKQRAERLLAAAEQAAALLRERVEAQRQLATARGTIETQQALLQAQGEKLAATVAVGRLLEEKEKALATAVADIEALRQDLVRERTALAATRDEVRERQAAVQQLTAKATDLGTQNLALSAQLRDRNRTAEDSGRSQQDIQEQLRQARDLLTAAEGERAQLRQKTTDQLALLRQQEKGLRDLEQQRRELSDRADLLARDLAAQKTSGEAQAAAFARDAASMKAKSEVVDGLAASLSDADALTQDLRRQVAVMQQDKLASETRYQEARRETQERDQEIARYRTAAAQDTTAKEKALLQQLQEAATRLEAETEKRRALEAVLASLPAAAAPPPVAASAASPAPVDPERDRREREQATLVRGYLRQAVAAEKEGKIEAARWNYLRVLEHDGESKLAAQRLGLLAAEHGNEEDAERYLKRAFKLDPDDLQTIVPLGFALLRRQEPDLAVSMLSRAVALEPTNAVAHRCLGLACSSLGWYDAAEVQFRRAHELNAKDPENAFNLAVLLSSRQPPRQEEARQWYERALALGSARDPGLDRLFGIGK
jgi:chromosome segregation ATPase